MQGRTSNRLSSLADPSQPVSTDPSQKDSMVECTTKIVKQSKDSYLALSLAINDLLIAVSFAKSASEPYLECVLEYFQRFPGPGHPCGAPILNEDSVKLRLWFSFSSISLRIWLFSKKNMIV